MDVGEKPYKNNVAYWLFNQVYEFVFPLQVLSLHAETITFKPAMACFDRTTMFFSEAHSLTYIVGFSIQVAKNKSQHCSFAISV